MPGTPIKRTLGRKAWLIKDKPFSPGEEICVTHDPIQSTVAWLAWGIVCPTYTGPRDSPDPPACFPEIPGTWFDSGHLMGLALGGSDDQRNLVPQIRSQNQAGDWAKFERVAVMLAKETWEKHQRYLYFGAEAVYRPQGTDPFHLHVPASIKASFMALKGPPDGNWEEEVPDMPPDAAHAVAKSNGWEPKKLFTKTFDNALTIQDLHLIYNDVKVANQKHAESYCMGELIHTFEQKPGGEIVVENALKASFPNGDVKKWRAMYATAHSSPQFHEGMWGRVDPEIAKLLKRLRDREIQLRIETEQEWLNNLQHDPPTSQSDRKELIEGFTKKGPRRKQSTGSLTDFQRFQEALVRAEVANQPIPAGATRGSARLQVKNKVNETPAEGKKREEEDLNKRQKMGEK